MICDSKKAADTMISYLCDTPVLAPQLNMVGKQLSMDSVTALICFANMTDQPMSRHNDVTVRKVVDYAK